MARWLTGMIADYHGPRTAYEGRPVFVDHVEVASRECEMDVVWFRPIGPDGELETSAQPDYDKAGFFMNPRMPKKVIVVDRS